MPVRITTETQSDALVRVYSLGEDRLELSVIGESLNIGSNYTSPDGATSFTQGVWAVSGEQVRHLAQGTRMCIYAGQRASMRASSDDHFAITVGADERVWVSHDTQGWAGTDVSGGTCDAPTELWSAMLGEVSVFCRTSPEQWHDILAEMPLPTPRMDDRGSFAGALGSRR